MAYLGPDENEDMKGIDMKAGSTTIMGGTIGFAQSFRDKLQHLHRERHDVMNHMMRLERDIMVVERIIG